ncbi:MAG: MBL fold metallo-hydrolase [Bacteroidales bacterium]|nr:MBL fold metallo-hydrolase [Bacteroidales bacterium]
MLHTRIFTFNPLGTNCIVSWADNSPNCTVVDPGMSSEEGLKELLDFFEVHSLTPDAILLTHGHFDHVWGVERLLERFEVPVYMNPLDKGILANGASAFRGMQSFKSMQHNFPTKDIADGDTVTTGGTAWRVITTPGHTPGGVCFYSAENNLLLSGDTLFAGSIGRTDLEGGDYDILMASIKEKLLTLPGPTDVIPGHGQPTSIAREGMYNPFLEPFNEPMENDNSSVI